MAKLVRVKDEQSVTALEITAGGRLYNVIVDSEDTGKALLKHGKLRRRVTIIPLNKVGRMRGVVDTEQQCYAFLPSFSPSDQTPLHPQRQNPCGPGPCWC